MAKSATGGTRVGWTTCASKRIVIHSAVLHSGQWELCPYLDSLSLFSTFSEYILYQFPEPFLRRCVCRVWMGSQVGRQWGFEKLCHQQDASEGIGALFTKAWRRT